MNSLSLLDNKSSLSTGSASSVITCTPALATLLIGAIVIMYDVVIKRPGLAGYHLVITIGATIGVLLLCIMGLGGVGTFVILFPIIIFVAIIVIIMLALMIGNPKDVSSNEVIITPKPSTDNVHKQKRISSSYKYVMTGKGFSLF